VGTLDPQLETLIQLSRASSLQGGWSPYVLLQEIVESVSACGLPSGTERHFLEAVWKELPQKVKARVLARAAERVAES
jgi:hypothetical protein